MDQVRRRWQASVNPKKIRTQVLAIKLLPKIFHVWCNLSVNFLKKKTFGLRKKILVKRGLAYLSHGIGGASTVILFSAVCLQKKSSEAFSCDFKLLCFSKSRWWSWSFSYSLIQYICLYAVLNLFGHLGTHFDPLGPSPIPIRCRCDLGNAHRQQIRPYMEKTSIFDQGPLDFEYLGLSKSHEGYGSR